MRFSIDLSTGRILDYGPIGRICLAIILILFLFLVETTRVIIQNVRESHRITEEISVLRLRLKNSKPVLRIKDDETLRTRTNYFNKIIESKTYNWLGLLDNVEAATPAGIALSGLSPDRRNSLLKLEGRARDFGKIREYMERLAESEYFYDIQLLSHRNVVLWEQANGFEFAILCRVKL